MRLKIVICIILICSSAPYSLSKTEGSIPFFIMSKIKADFPGAVIANKKDFGSYLFRLKDYNINIENLLNTVIIFDITNDSENDYTLLLINRNKRYFAFISYISNDDYSTPRLLSISEWPNDHDGTIWQVMRLKKPGENGMANEKYFNAPGKDYPYLKNYTDADIIEYKKAIELYTSIPAIERSNAAYGSFDEDDLFYCMESHYFNNEHFETLSKCD